MHFEQAETGNVVSLILEGPLDEEGAPDLLPAVDRALQVAARLFLVDLGKVPHANSVGLEVLVGMARRISEAGGRIVFVEPSEVMAQILALTRLDQRLEILETREEAFLVLREEG
jgi:anti-anti-sigma factor